MTIRSFKTSMIVVLALAALVIPYAVSSVEIRTTEDIVSFHSGGIPMWEEVFVNRNAIDLRDFRADSFEVGIP